MSYGVAIDLGTSYTAAAVNHNDRCEIVTLGNRAAVIPSVVYLHRDGTILTGDSANRRALTEPGRVAREFKRRIGDPTPFILGGTPYSAESLSARLMSWVIETVAGLEGGPPENVVVTHPANWGDYKKDLLRQAVRLSGLAGAGFITEPEAAAIYYSSLERVEPGMVVAVYDLGGGTFDAVLLRKTDDVGFEILGEPEGIERLGGIDFDEAVFQFVAAGLDGAIDELDPEDPATLGAVGRLRQECVAAKEALSGDTDTSIPVLLPNVSTEVRITRPEFEAMIRPTLADTLSAMARAIDSAGMRAEDVDRILLVGGSSRIPLVGQLVAAEFDRPIAVDAQPKHAVALGAAAMIGSLPDEESPAAVPTVGTGGRAAEVEAPIKEAGDADGDTEAPAADVPPTESARPARRWVLPVLGGVAAVVIAIVAVLLLSGDGGEEAAVDGVAPTATTQAAATTTVASTSTTPAGGATIAVTTEVPLSFETWVLTTVDDEGGTGVRPAMAVGADGSQSIVYWNPTTDDLRFALCRDPACRAVAKSIIDQGQVGEWSSIALGADGLAIVSYYDQGQGNLKAAHCQDEACTSATISVVDADVRVGKYNSVAIGVDGLPIISYFDQDNADLKVAHCDVPDCSSATVFTVDGDGEVGADTAITIGSDGLAVISYNDKSTAELKVAHCETVDCSAATLVTIGVGGIGTDITIGADGFPLISYGVIDLNQVRLARCLDLVCATATIVIVAEAAPGMTCETPRCMGASDTSVAVDADGLAQVSYHHDTDGLWMARCGDPNCDAIAAYPVDTHPAAGTDSSIGIHPSGITSIVYFSGEEVSLRAATTDR